ncbi:hypothetical protein FACS189472_03680 [Alphaproteobacteria bacterium]|nr:hypothetical protein FACS189472_03680 [Alphaproteobacteria bacterium]
MSNMVSKLLCSVLAASVMLSFSADADGLEATAGRKKALKPRAIKQNRQRSSRLARKKGQRQGVPRLKNKKGNAHNGTRKKGAVSGKKTRPNNRGSTKPVKRGRDKDEPEYRNVSPSDSGKNAAQNQNVDVDGEEFGKEYESVYSTDDFVSNADDADYSGPAGGPTALTPVGPNASHDGNAITEPLLEKPIKIIQKSHTASAGDNTTVYVWQNMPDKDGDYVPHFWVGLRKTGYNRPKTWSSPGRSCNNSAPAAGSNDKPVLKDLDQTGLDAVREDTGGLIAYTKKDLEHSSIVDTTYNGKVSITRHIIPGPIKNPIAEAQLPTGPQNQKYSECRWIPVREILDAVDNDTEVNGYKMAFPRPLQRDSLVRAVLERILKKTTPTKNATPPVVPTVQPYLSNTLSGQPMPLTHIDRKPIDTTPGRRNAGGVLWTKYGNDPDPAENYYTLVCLSTYGKYPGWGDLGGGEDKKDNRNLEKTAKREIFEESGLTVDGGFASYLDSWKHRTSAYRTFFIPLTRLVTDEIKLSDEHSAWAWVSIKDLLNAARNKGFKTFNGHNLRILQGRRYTKAFKAYQPLQGVTTLDFRPEFWTTIKDESMQAELDEILKGNRDWQLK